MTNKGIAKPVLLSSLTILLCLLFSQKVLASSEMVDSYQQNDMDTTVTDITWKGQSWTATSTYTVTSVKIKARRESTPGTTFMSIRNANDKATDVCTSTVNGNDFSDSTYALAEFTFSNCPEFQASSTYFFNLHCTANYFYMGVFETGTYGAGSGYEAYDNGGTSWTQKDWDAYFEIYAEVGEEESTSTATTTETDLSTANSIIYFSMIIWIFSVIAIYLLTFFVIIKA